MLFFIIPVNRTPGVHTGPAPGASWEKQKKSFSPNKADSFHILYVAMYSGPLYKFCLPNLLVKFLNTIKAQEETMPCVPSHVQALVVSI